MFGDGLESKDGIRSFLMIGQSNMCGRGNLFEVEPIRNKRCYMLRMGRWQPMCEPINPDRGINAKFHPGVGLAASFADDFAKETGCEVGLIPCADGGTRIQQWQPGEILYDHAVMMARLAMRTSRLAGILWHQGESNTPDLEENAYRELFLNTMNSLRRDLGAEELPLIIGEIPGSILYGEGMLDTSRFNRLLHQLKDELPMCGIAKAAELPLKADNLHFCSESCRVLGHRYFEVYKELTKR